MSKHQVLERHASHHGHLWTLLDGTPAHAPVGELTRNGQGEIACHLCGRWFTHLGLHLRRHDWTAKQYRAAVGLPLREPLCSRDLSGDIARRQARHWSQDAAVRERFADGQWMARTGELARLSAEATRRRTIEGTVPEPVLRQRNDRLAAGRATARQRQQTRLADLVHAHGASDLHDLLRTAYANGATLESLAKLTRLSRANLRRELSEARVTLRPAGVNRPESKHRRAADTDQLVAELVGTADLRRWLGDQRAAGATFRALAAQTGRSVPWVQSRLAGTVTTRSSAGSVGRATNNGQNVTAQGSR